MQHRHLLPNEIDLLLDGDAGFGATPLRAHIDECTDCRARLDEARVMADALEHLPHFAPRPGFADRVLCQVQIVEPWHVAAVATVRRVVPESRPLRVLTIAGTGLASVAISAGALGLALGTRLTVGSATVITTRIRDAILGGLQDAVSSVFGAGAATALQSDGALAMSAAAVALVAAVGGAAFGFRALAAASRQRGS